MTIAEFATVNRITMQAERTDSNPNMGTDMDHWRCTLRHAGRRYSLTFSMGFGHGGRVPTVADVLYSVQSDASYPDMPFEEWARDLGYDPDSRKAERVYKACVTQTERARRLIGDDLWEDFLNTTEGGAK